MTPAMTSCSDWLNSTPAETKVEPFGLSLWSQRKTDPNSEMTRCVSKQCANFGKPLFRQAWTIFDNFS